MSDEELRRKHSFAGEYSSHSLQLTDSNDDDHDEFRLRLCPGPGPSVVVDHAAHIKRELDGQATVAIANPTLLTSSSPRGPPTAATTTAMASPRGSNSGSNGGHVSAAEGGGGGGGVGKRKGATPSFKLAPPPEPEPEPALAGFDLRQIPKVTTHATPS